MIIRRSSQGENIRIYRNTTPGATRIRTYKDSSTASVSYPSSKIYFVTVDSKVVKSTNSLKVAEEFYTTECKKVYSNTHGRQLIGKHKMINKVCTSKDDYPTSSNSKDEIKAFLDIRIIKYNASDTKNELLDIVTNLNPYSELDWE
tara:strand:- start:589 stop:1026 length:438 start_codon:yes stop_codon:yes gene_type:complete